MWCCLEMAGPESQSSSAGAAIKGFNRVICVSFWLVLAHRGCTDPQRGRYLDDNRGSISSLCLPLVNIYLRKRVIVRDVGPDSFHKLAAGSMIDLRGSSLDLRGSSLGLPVAWLCRIVTRAIRFWDGLSV